MKRNQILLIVAFTVILSVAVNYGIQSIFQKMILRFLLNHQIQNLSLLIIFKEKQSTKI